MRAPIFSIGTILYWLATGKLPFVGPNPSALFKQILHGEYEDPQRAEPKIGNGLAGILRRTLERDVDARYSSATELAADLARELVSVDVTAPELALRDYLKNPEDFAGSFGPKLLATLVKSGKAALAERNVGRAVDRFNRVLAVEPDHNEVRSLMGKIGNSSEARARNLRRAGVILGSVVSVGAVVGLAREGWREWEQSAVRDAGGGELRAH